MSPHEVKAAERTLRRPVRGATKLHTARLVALVVVLGTLAVLGLSLAVLGALRGSRMLALETASQSAGNLALAVTDAVARTAQSVDVLLLSVAAQLDLGDGGGNDGALDETLRQLLRYWPHVRQVAVIAADGRVLGDSGGGRLTAALDAAALFAEAGQVPSRMVVAPVRPGRFLGVADPAAPHRHIPFLRLHAPHDGGPPVLLVAAVNPLYVHDIFAGLDLPDSARLRLWRYDGTLLVGTADDTDYTAAGHQGERLFTQGLKQAEHGEFTEIDGDGVERITSYRTAMNWPLVVSVGLSRDDVLAKWRDSAVPLLWPVGVLGLALIVATAVLTRALVQRLRAEAMLVLSEQVLQTMSNGVAISDATQPDLPLVYVNPAFESISGYAADEVLGRNPRFLHGEDRDQPGLEQMRQAVADGRSVNAVIRNYRADGSLYWNEITISAVRAISGRLTHFVAIQRDITDQELHRVELNRAYARIERYSAELERFSFILAHHLQEPVRHIALYSQLLLKAQDGAADPELRQYLGYLEKAGLRLKDLLRDVQLYLAVDRLAMAGGSAQAEAVLDAQWEVRTRDLLEADLQSGALPRVQVPPRRLADLFGVLVDNAIVFRHPERPLRMTVSAQPDEGGFWRFRFVDNGIGIPPEFLDKVFGVFERPHGRDHYPGNGVGLAIARKLVETLGGRIHAESDGCSGTTIVLTLPAATE